MSIIPVGTPAAEVAVTVEVVRSLLQSQHPDLAHLPLQLANTGWDNAMFRLGDQLAVRLPRRKLGAVLIEKEQTWLPHLAPQLTLPVPMPVRVGVPSADYPWRWSVVPWLTGQTADQETLKPGEAARFAMFLRSLHTPAPHNAPPNAFRGVALSARAALIDQRIARLERSTTVITAELKQLWQCTCEAPAAATRQWLHGDLHPHNILVQAKTLTGVIDWGDLTAGDVATDLAAIWMLFDNKLHREEAIQAYGVEAATLLRAKGWAIFFGTILLETGLVDNPSHAAIGRRTLQRLVEDGA